MSNQNDEAFRRVCELTVAMNAASGSLAFDKNEFSRLPDHSKTTTRLKSEDLQQVIDALYHALTDGMYSMMVGKNGCTAQFIAAQFKNGHMRQSQLEPKVIEEALTQIIDNLDQYPQLKAIKCDISYSDDGSSFMVPKGVRAFCVKGKE
ncbi:hypothetical protein I4U23_004126 [Adineta vaga]|nr:hypothetical protein I4U23_004126 [Adineta vaga]